jgi:hypothetical protein
MPTANNEFNNHLLTAIYMPAFALGARGPKEPKPGFCP